jgi:hypothetical protein
MPELPSRRQAAENRRVVATRTIPPATRLRMGAFRAKAATTQWRLAT